MTRRRKTFTTVATTRTGAKHHHRVPESNVLDLKSILAASREKEEPATKPRRSLLSWWKQRTSKPATLDEIKRDEGDLPTSDLEGAQDNAIAPDPIPSGAPDPYFITYDDASENDADTHEDEEGEEVILAGPQPAPPIEPLAPPTNTPPEQPFVATPVRLLPSLASFAGICALILLPILGYGMYSDAQDTKQKVLGVSEEALLHISNARSSLGALDPANANQEFSSALAAFSAAQEQVDRFGILLDVLPVSKISSGTHLITAGTALSEAGQELSQALLAFSSNDEIGFTTAFSTAQEHLRAMRDQLLVAVDEIKDVKVEDLPAEHQASFSELQTSLPALSQDIEHLLNISDVLLEIFGATSQQRYLVLFQNPHELRPTGGFIGSFAAVTIQDGVIQELEIPGGGTYDVSGQQRTLFEPPKPLGLVASRWEIQDANWSPDFPWSARKVQLMYQDAGGPSTNGVIAIDTVVLETLLELTGPVELPDYGVTVSAENVVDVLMRQIAEVRDESSAPKAMIADLVPEVLNRAMTLSSDRAPDVMVAMDRLLREKHLLLFSRDEALQDRIQQFGWAGEFRDTSGDFLHMNFANIAGGKTDGEIETLSELNTQMNQDGVITHELTITRTHKGDPSDPIYGANNTSYLRVYVPQGAKLLHASGFAKIDPRKFLYADPNATLDPELVSLEGPITIDETSGTAMSSEMGKTVFGNWILTPVGQTSRVQLVYQLDQPLEFRGTFRHVAPYQLYVQSQPGNSQMVFSHTLTQNAGETVWVYPEDLPRSAENIWSDQRVLSSDLLFAAIIRK